MNSQKPQRQRQRPKGRTGRRGPVPPPGGWDVMRAAEALFPGAPQRIWEEGNPDQFHALFGRLAVDLIRAIRARDDLCLTGQDVSLPIHHARVTVPRDALFEGGALMRLGILEGTLRISWPPGTGRESAFVAVRVESVKRLDKGVDVTRPPVEAVLVEKASKKPVDELSAWFKEWSKAHPNPSDKEVHEAANIKFDPEHIARARIEALRRRPGERRKTGPKPKP